ncbi:TlpA disulfide reductase family protein [Flavobacterium sp. KACC 22761]|uniref:TlpA family protein disulfide reductase n=1 Tax=Flavobacterium sp. KACC 22761 TaxID=3092665 RepID=UPI002A758386|nr:TlpA disulfide reductase family protein [Flavobacterium sp. KACC 22761]WPO76861.1 TlpA disulfide reductase family protein [Flavobacterium sp. KACC 22761]
MKKNLLLLLIVVLYSFTTPEGTTTVSGKITNTENKTIRIKGELFDKEIKLKADGSFSENLTVEFGRVYKIETTKNSIPVYLAKDSKLIINADDANLASTLKFTGKGSVENQYLAQKQLIISANPYDVLYALNENEFLKKLQEIKASVTNLYTKTKFTDASFKEKEARSIYYFEQKNLLFYEKSHGFYGHDTNFKVSETYPKIDERIDMDNDSDFLFSDDYQQIVLNRFYENVAGDVNNIFADGNNAIPKIKALKSQSIKNRLIENSSFNINIENPNYAKIYQEYSSITNDPILKEKLTALYNTTNAVQPGKPSPTFNYENHKGGKTTLEDLKGKYIYIDLWATWCGPCVKEIPFLQKLEEQYKGKNIEFVTISVDAMKDHDKWSKFVTEKQLGGIQLLADNEFKSEFMKAYGIEQIPTFILLDPNGNIVSARAPKPSDPKLIELLNSLKI